MDESSPPKSSFIQFLVYAQFYFLSIAQILGTGILGLPVTLAESGYTPFLITFILTFLMQSLLVIFVTDLLQKAVAIQIEHPRCSAVLVDETSDMTPLNQSFKEGDYTSGNNREHKPGLSSSELNEALSKSADVRPPDLHLLAELFLPRWLVFPFDIMFALYSIALLVSYGLAGGQSWAELINGNENTVVTLPIFCCGLTLLICFAQKIIMPVVSVFTFLKGSLLTTTVVVAFIVGADIHQQVVNDFAYTARPLLMGSVALGGVPFMMPYMYGKISQEKGQVKYYRMACILGVLTCCLLNLGWCWAVLQVVPQTMSQCVNRLSEKAFPLTNSSICIHPNISLELAKKLGEISTVPFREVIDHQYPQYSWVAMLVTLFIVISITVSFTINGSVLIHTVDGWVESNWPKDRCRCWDFRWCTTQSIVQKFLGLVLLGIVFAIAMFNPQGLEQVLEKAATMLANCLFGIFFFTTIYVTSSEKIRSVTIPLPLSSWLVPLQYILMLYFNLLVLYAAVTWVMEGFVKVLEKAVSLLLNILVGIFFFIMINRTSKEKYRNLTIPLPLNGWFIHLQYLILIYLGGFAVIYDVVTWIMELFGINHY